MDNQNAEISRPSQKVQYLGHGAGTGGLQAHSVGAEYPYTIVGTQAHSEAPTGWYCMDTRTGKRGTPRRSYKEAEIDLWSLKIRNMMHS